MNYAMNTHLDNRGSDSLNLEAGLYCNHYTNITSKLGPPLTIRPPPFLGLKSYIGLFRVNTE